MAERLLAQHGALPVRRPATGRAAGHVGKLALTRIDGISAGAALTVLTEVGFNLAAFPSEKHFVSWLRLCPRTPISGGKPLKKRSNALGANAARALGYDLVPTAPEPST